ncbi:MAG: VWA domain-containing protein, partial [Spirochaetales bacterium]|nr:VWA domain-containing protein [Spirochaetales bacterium]
MKKFLITAVLFLIFIQFGISEQIDNIVLLDTSESMFPYYSGTIDYLIEDIVQKQLQSGDTFHLLSFNDFPEYEISRTIRSEIEIKEIFNRILLLQPIGKYTDLISAFSFLYEYTEKLQLNSLKRIIILTDGIHDPPPESPYPVSSDNITNIVKISENMRRQGWDVSLVQFPIINASDGSSSGTGS